MSRLLILLCVGLCCTHLYAGQLQVPGDDILTIHVEDWKEQDRAIENTSLFRFWSSKGMEKLRLATEAWWEAKKKKKNELSEVSHRLLGGEILFRLADFGVNAASGNVDLHASLAFEAGDVEAVARAMEQLKKKKGDKYRQPDVTIAGHDFLVWSLSSSAKRKDGLRVSLQVRLGKVKDYVYVGVGSKGDLDAEIASLVASIKNKKSKRAEHGLTLHFKHRQLMTRILTGVEYALKQSFQSGAPPQGVASFLAMGMFEPKKIAASLGLLDLEKMSAHWRWKKRGGEGKLLMRLANEPRGLMKMSIPKVDSPCEPMPVWLPEKLWGYRASSLPLNEWFGIVTGWIQTNIPFLGPMVFGQIQVFNQKHGIDVAKLFEHFNGQMHEFQADPNSGEELPQNQVVALGINKVKELEAVFKKALKGSAFPAEERKVNGGSIYSYAVKNGPVKIDAAVGFKGNYFFYSASRKYLESIYKRMDAKPGNNFSRSKSMSRYHGKLPKKYHALQVFDLNAPLRWVIGLARKNADKVNERSHDWEFQPDFKTLPDPASIKEDFGTLFMVGVRKGLNFDYDISFDD